MWTTPFGIAITPSVRLALALCVVHTAAAAAVWGAPVPVWLQAGFTLAIAGNLVSGLLRKAALLSDVAIVALEIADDGRMSARTRSGAWRECELLPSSYVTPALTILGLRPQGGRRVRHVVLVGDNCDAQDFRRLRVWLRWAARPGTQGGAAAADQSS